jgi:hypothetical protein
VGKYHDSLGLPMKYYSKLAGCRRERKCIMRSKKLRSGLITVLLVSLSLASTSNAWTIFPRTRPRVATPEYSLTRLWIGVVIVRISCDTAGATIKYTWTNGTDVEDAPNPTYFSRTYRRPLWVTRDAVIKARAYKTGWRSSYVRWLRIDFWPYDN